MRYFLMEVEVVVDVTVHSYNQVLVKAKDSEAAAVRVINLGLGTNPKLLGMFEPMELDKNVFTRRT